MFESHLIHGRPLKNLCTWGVQSGRSAEFSHWPPGCQGQAASKWASLAPRFVAVDFGFKGLRGFSWGLGDDYF